MVLKKIGAGEIHCAAGLFHFPSLPPNVLAIVEAGGLVKYTQQQLAARKLAQNKGRD